MAAHAKLGASSAKRWMTCPASVPMSVGVPNTGSPYASLGSAAHALAEHCLLTGDLPVELLGGAVPDEEYADYVVDEDMANAVAVYVDHIRQRHGHFGAFTRAQVERRVSLEAWCAEFEGMFGTADFIAVSDRVLYVDDYKHGEGEAVEAQDNPQALYYAAGALLDTFGADKLRKGEVEVDEVHVTIAQPRKPHSAGPVRTAVYSVQDVIGWLDGEVLPAVKRVHRAEEIDATSIDSADMEETLEAEQMFSPSDDACRWCLAKGFCKPFARHATSNALLEFDEESGAVSSAFDREKMTPEQIAQVLDSRAAVEKWLAGVEAYAKMSAERGVDVTAGRYGLGVGRSTRKWGDEGEATRFLLGLGLDEDSVFKRSLASPAQAEKLVGKEYKEALADLVVKTEGKPKLVKVSTDPDAKAKNAADEFD